MQNLRLKVSLHCASCAVVVEKQLKKIKVKTKINPVLKIVDCTFDPSETNEEIIIKNIKKLGYNVDKY